MNLVYIYLNYTLSYFQNKNNSNNNNKVPEKYQGLWQRILLEEPVRTVKDCIEYGSDVFWLQTDSWYIDIRNVSYENKIRGFAGKCKVLNSGKSGKDILTWMRYIDSAPEFLPNGVDSAEAYFLDEDTLVEDGGNDYKEIWKRIKKFNENNENMKNDKNHVTLKIDLIEMEAKNDEEGISISFISKNKEGKLLKYITSTKKI